MAGPRAAPIGGANLLSDFVALLTILAVSGHPPLLLLSSLAGGFYGPLQPLPPLQQRREGGEEERLPRRVPRLPLAK